MSKLNLQSIFDAILDIKGELGEIKGQVTGIYTQTKATNGSVKAHDVRINKNEHKIDVMTGKATIIGALFGFIGAVVIALFKTK